MTRETSEDQSMPVGATMTPKQVRMLWIAVVVMGIMLIVGFFVVVGKIIYEGTKLGKGDDKKADVSLEQPVRVIPPEVRLYLPPGSAVKTMTLDGKRLAIYSVSVQGEEITILDLTTGNVVSRVKIDRN